MSSVMLLYHTYFEWCYTNQMQEKKKLEWRVGLWIGQASWRFHDMVYPPSEVYCVCTWNGQEITSCVSILAETMHHSSFFFKKKRLQKYLSSMFVGPCHQGMAHSQVADGGANKLNKQSRTADKGWSSSLGVGQGANNSSPWNNTVTKYSWARWFLWRQWRVLVSTVMNFRVP